MERRIDQSIAQITEVLSTAVSQQMLQDAAGWTALTGRQANDYDMTAADLRKAREQSLRLWWVNGDVAQAAFLLSSGVFGRGIAAPKCQDPQVQEVVNRFWEDEDNQLALLGIQAQQRADLRFMLDGELFVTIHTSEADSVVKLGLLHPSEITDVITHPGNWLKPVLYKREFVRRRYDFKTRTWVPESQLAVEYYPVWSFGETDPSEDPEAFDLIQQAGAQLAEAHVYHVAVNTAGLRGIPEAYRSYDWAKTHARALADMATLTKALSMIAWTKKMRTKSAAAIDAAARMYHDPPPGPGGVQVQNENVSMEPVNVGTGQVSNQQATARLAHLETIKPHGFGEHWYGDASTGNLATATAMELPAIWRIEVRQALWEQVYEALCQYAVRRAIERADFPMPRLSPDVDAYMDVDFPPAQPNTPGSTALLLGALAGASGTLIDEREAAYQAYVALGTNDIAEVMEKQFPDGELPEPPPPPESPQIVQVGAPAIVPAPEGVVTEAAPRSKNVLRTEHEITARVIRPWRSKIGKWLKGQGGQIPGKPGLLTMVEEDLRPDEDALLTAISRGMLAGADEGGAIALRKIRRRARAGEARAREATPPRETVAERLARGEGANAIRQGFTFHLRDPELLAKLQERGQKITGEITKNMLGDLHQVLSMQFYEQGLSPRELAAELDAIFPATYANRGLAIARTETGSAQNEVQRIAFGRNGVERKQWFSTMDGKTRDSHIEAHGQVVGIDEPFIVGGSELMQPGDPSGPVEEIANCRCDTLPVTDDDFELPEQPWDGGIAYEKLSTFGGE